MNTKQHQIFLISGFIAALAGMVLTIYYLYFAECINRPVFYIGAILNVILVIFLIRLIRKQQKNKS